MNVVSKVLFVCIISLLFFDIGNLNAIRQGTEGFYLLISQEMYDAGELLSPRIYGDYHWSKPPLQFWFPMPLFHFFGGSYLEWSRISILIFSLLAAFVTSLWYESELKRNWFEAFGFLLFPIYFIKYSRIFMMEMTLTYLTTLATLFFYSSLQRSSKSKLVMASVLGGLSVLIKGPVSLVMIAPSSFFGSIIKNKKTLPKFLLFIVLSFIFGSLWFFISYLKFGEGFFNYFFIRENLGKFNSKNYPITSVIQGLFIYAFPAVLLLFPIIKEKRSTILDLKINRFLLLSFCFFYFLWFLPKQKSHHYAVPAIPVLLLFISYNFNTLKNQTQRFYTKILDSTAYVFFAFGFIIIALSIYFKSDLKILNFNSYIGGAFFCLAVWSYLKKVNLKELKYLKYILPTIFLWQFILPLGILPTVPSKAVEIMKEAHRVFVGYRKPFFVKEAIQREINFLPNEGLSSDEIRKDDIVFIGRADLAQKIINTKDFMVLTKWKVWKRGAKSKDILKAIKDQQLSQLQETYYLVRKL
jgi:4-amino-4-deoxy-L-arabinose transferase-like glycosyltransferase